ncbi:MAG: hypothetical protein LBM66_02950 [Bifidobacteriaceae bacterium]|jgi:hypothetical protein|nr:hypothetical protein [Bifidobacteriaceae bacterium]
MRAYEFTVVVSGVDLMDEAQVDALFTNRFVLVPACQDGVTILSAEVEAKDGAKAFTAFDQYLAAALPASRICRIDQDLVNTSEIATRLDKSRETVRKWAMGERRPRETFPPHYTVCGGQKLWLWADVFAWAARCGQALEDEPIPLDPVFVARYNGQHAAVSAAAASDLDRLLAFPGMTKRGRSSTAIREAA